VQVFGSLDLGVNHFVTPGTHSKWITTKARQLLRYATYVTGEVFAALKDHTMLGRLMKPGPDDEEAFAWGVRAALDDPAGFLHRIFSARSWTIWRNRAGGDCLLPLRASDRHGSGACHPRQSAGCGICGAGPRPGSAALCEGNRDRGAESALWRSAGHREGAHHHCAEGRHHMNFEDAARDCGIIAILRG